MMIPPLSPPLSLTLALTVTLALTPSGWAQTAPPTLDPTIPGGITSVDTPELSITYFLGFQNGMFTEQLNLGMFRLENVSDRTLRGRLEILHITTVSRLAPVQAVVNSRPIELSPHLRQVAFLDFAPLYGDPAIVVRWVDPEGATRWQRHHLFDRSITARSEDVRIWAFVAEESLVTAEAFALPSPDPETKVLRVEPTITVDNLPVWALPADPILMASVDAIFLGRTTLDRLSPGQRAGLVHFTARGGTLILPNDVPAFTEKDWALVPLTPPDPEGRAARFGLGQVLRFSPPICEPRNRRPCAGWRPLSWPPCPAWIPPSVRADIRITDRACRFILRALRPAARDPPAPRVPASWRPFSLP